MIGPTDLLHPSPATHFKTFQVFLIYDYSLKIIVPQRPWFDNRTVNVGFIVDEVVMRFFSLQSFLLILLIQHGRHIPLAIRIVMKLKSLSNSINLLVFVVKGKAVPLQVWSGPKGSKKLCFLDFVTTVVYGVKVVSPTHRPLLPPGNSPGTHFC
jgi:hypothetical protein